MEYCPHCMQLTQGPHCSHCGGQLRWVAPATQLPLGTLLRGSSGRMYQVGAAKGQGGFGITYAAMDLTGNFRVAIKEYYPSRWAMRDRLNQVIPATGQGNTFQGGRNSFLEEARMLSSVGALPSVVSVRDYFEANGTAYLVMEYVEGLPLHKVVSQRGRMTREELFGLLPELMRDLGILHRAGVIHRDISPDNLILTTDGKLKLLDFGSARTMQDGKDMTIVMKAGFSPLEQHQSKGQGPYTDVYALAATIYYCLTGVVPPSSMDRITEDELQPPHLLGAGISRQEEQALLWAMNLHAQHRPQTVEDFARALLEPQTTIPSHTVEGQRKPQVPRPEDVQKIPVREDNRKKRSGKKPLIAAIAGGAAVLILAVAVLALTVFGTKSQGDYRYRVRGGEAWLVGYEGNASEVAIPDSLGKHSVVGLEEGAFEGSRSLVSVTVPSQVHTLAEGAFRDCRNLELVTFLGRTTEVEPRSFEGCDALRCILTPSEKSADQVDRALDMEDLAICYLNQPLLGGSLKQVEISGGVAYGINERSEAQVLVMPGNVNVRDLPDALGTCRVFDMNGQRVGVTVGVTEDGFAYEVHQNHVSIVGYSGEGVVFVPDTIDGKPVTVICSAAFLGNSEMTSLFLPVDCAEIQAGALEGCTGLRDLYVYSDMVVDSGVFLDCTALRCVVTGSNLAFNWALPAGCQVYEMGMETQAGSLFYVEVDEDGVIYGVTEEEQALLLHVPAGLSRVECYSTVSECPVTWVHPQALKDAPEDVYIVMAPEMTFPYELYSRAAWENFAFGDTSHSWVMTCMVCQEVNSITGQQYLQPDALLVEASMIRSEELSRYFEHSRPDGTPWKTLLTDMGVNWDMGTSYKDKVSTQDEEAYSEGFDVMVEDMTAAFADGTDEGLPYEGFGMAMYFHEATETVFMQAYGVTRDPE